MSAVVEGLWLLADVGLSWLLPNTAVVATNIRRRSTPDAGGCCLRLWPGLRRRSHAPDCAG